MPRRIARLTVDEGNLRSRGTGFVIGPRHLLTAFHVVGDRLGRQPYTQPILVEFPLAPIAAPTVKLGPHDIDADWAVLELDADLPDAAPYPLRRPHRATDPWQSYGYPNDDGSGDPFTGTITGVDPRVVLFCEQARQGARVPGLSGAPCLVDGHAIGIILSATDWKQCGYQDGRMYICPIETIAAACELVKRLVPERPPYADQVQAELAPPGVTALLPLSARQAKLPDGIDAARLAPLVSEQLLRRDPVDAVPLLDPLTPQLEPASCDQILYFTALARLSVEETAAVTQAILAATEKTIIGLNAATSSFGERFVRRAGHLSPDHPGWRVGVRTLDATHAERGDQQFLDDCRARLASVLVCDPDELEAEYAAHDHVGEPLILVVPPHLPTPESVAALHETFKMVRLVLLCGPDGLAEVRTTFPDATIVQPPVAAGAETTSEKQLRTSQKKMQARYQAQGRIR